ncbi:MAG TPA: hypothetical protein VM100_00615 [Longimicrobiales bacterium]|nr:hypothetical protein [Longimicrobiales bacterium]
MSFKRVIHEVHRRSIWQVLLIYLGASWAVLQVVDQVQGRLNLPDWVYGAALILLLIGLPIVLATAFVQEGTTTTSVTTDDAALPQRVLTWRNALGGGLLAFIGGGALLILWLNFSPKKDGDDVQASIAVLPFVDMSSSKDQEYFGDGITEEILNVLAQVPDLRVPARTSSFSFKGQNLSIREIAQKLGVATVLEGSVRKSGDRVRITAQLIDARTDRHLWSQTYERDLADVFAVQDEIAHAIVDALPLKKKENVAKSTMVEEATSNGAAHDSYLKGLHYWHGRVGTELPLALEEMKKATAADPNYARAWAGMALVYAVLPQYVPYDLGIAIREGKAAARRALELDPKAADAHAALGQIAQELEWDWASAASHYEQAVQIDSKLATAAQWRAELLAITGKTDEALVELDRAGKLDPLSPSIKTVRGYILMVNGQAARAEPLFRELVQQYPQYDYPKINLFQANVILGRMKEAQAVAPNDAWRVIASAFTDASKKNEAVRKMMSLERADLSTQIVVLLALNEPDSAAAAAKRAASEWRASIGYSAHAAISKPIANHPDFIEYKRKLGL